MKNFNLLGILISLVIILAGCSNPGVFDETYDNAVTRSDPTRPAETPVIVPSIETVRINTTVRFEAIAAANTVTPSTTYGWEVPVHCINARLIAENIMEMEFPNSTPTGVKWKVGCRLQTGNNFSPWGYYEFEVLGNRVKFEPDPGPGLEAVIK